MKSIRRTLWTAVKQRFQIPLAVASNEERIEVARINLVEDEKSMAKYEARPANGDATKRAELEKEEEMILHRLPGYVKGLLHGFENDAKVLLRVTRQHHYHRIILAGFFEHRLALLSAKLPPELLCRVRVMGWWGIGDAHQLQNQWRAGQKRRDGGGGGAAGALGTTNSSVESAFAALLPSTPLDPRLAVLPHPNPYASVVCASAGLGRRRRFFGRWPPVL